MHSSFRSLNIIVVFACVWLALSRSAGADELADLRALPVLQDGRVKPFDTAARAAVRSVCNRESMDGIDATTLALDWAAEPWNWESRPVLYVGPPELREHLHLPASQSLISPAAVRGSEDLQQLAASDGPLKNGAMELRDRLADFDLASSGRMYAIVPGDAVEAAWKALPDAAEEFSSPWRAALRAWAAGDHANAAAALADLRARLWSAHPVYDRKAIDREVLYNRVQPFHLTAALYAFSLLMILLANRWPRRWLAALGLMALAIAIAFNIAGFVARCSITGWAPVTNLYETVIWVAAVAAVIALVSSPWSAILAKRISAGDLTAAACGAAAGLVAAVVAAALPPDYGAAFRPLPLALRTNFWLSLHVLTIVSSYGALTLSMVAANVVLIQALRLGAFGSSAASLALSGNIRLVDRSVQIGTTLAIIGTLLGGLWADMAWGRFWGWDPKEVWALIIILAYLTLLHARLKGRLGDLGMAAASAGCFATVLMSWYGVNFVLAAGLHSYGFAPGAAGALLVSAYLLLQSVLLGVIGFRSRRVENQAGSAALAAGWSAGRGDPIARGVGKPALPARRS